MFGCPLSPGPAEGGVPPTAERVRAEVHGERLRVLLDVCDAARVCTCMICTRYYSVCGVHVWGAPVRVRDAVRYP
jgi:hypothetical protein